MWLLVSQIYLQKIIQTSPHSQLLQKVSNHPHLQHTSSYYCFNNHQKDRYFVVNDKHTWRLLKSAILNSLFPFLLTELRSVLISFELSWALIDIAFLLSLIRGHPFFSVNFETFEIIVQFWNCRHFLNMHPSENFKSQDNSQY